MNARIMCVTAFVVGCGTPTDPGTGTQTLFATIAITGKPDSTKFEVELLARGNPVVGANVAFTNVDTEEQIIAEQKSAGSYRITVDGYQRTLRVKITAGEDDLEATLEGPAPHVITHPPNNAIVRRGDFDQLKVEWEADDEADRVEVEPADAEKVTLEEDPFLVRIPLGGLKNGDQKLDVLRENVLELQGGASGSRMRTSYEVDNRFTLEG